MNKNGYSINTEYAILLIKRKGQNVEFLIDIEDIGKVLKYRWHIEIVRNDERYMYAAARINGKTIKLHRFLMNCPDNMVVDHLNHDTKDNRKVNLSICSAEKNRKNTITQKRETNKSGKVGVFKAKKTNSWRVSFKGIDLGHFKNLKDAIKTRVAAEKAYLLAIETIKKHK